MRAVVAAMLAAAAFAALPRPAAGQDSSFVKLRCDAQPGGTIRGVLLDDRSAAPLPQKTVYISFDCATRTDSLGRFEIAHVPPGAYHLQVAAWGFHPFVPLPVTVAADSIARVELRLRAENPALDCTENPACAATLRPDSAGEAGLTPGQRLTYAAWRTAFALTGWRAEPATTWMPCVEEPDSAVRQALLRRFGPLAAPAQCELDPTPRPRTRAKLIYLPGGQPARNLRIERVFPISADEALGHLSYLAGALWAVWWECRFRRQGDDWTPVFCRVEAVS